MRTRLRNFWDSVNASFWFIPAIMAVTAGALSFALVALDQALGSKLTFLYGYTRGPEGARSLLSTVAGSVITVAGVIFSITIAALSLASNQFGPRLLRNFMRDRGNQLVLGTFIATFIYCLLVLRTVNGSQEDAFVPHISVTFGVLLAVASMGVLIYFIHHVATLIQVEHIVGTVSDELLQTMNHLFPDELGIQPGKEKYGQLNAERELPGDFESRSQGISARKEGYLQAVDNESLMDLANRHDVICLVNYRPGHFIFKGMELVRVWPSEKVDQDFSDQLLTAFILGSSRSGTQDIEFTIDQLVEIALRALSPGINDPFTAINCIDRLGAGLNRLAKRVMPSPYRYQDNQKLRVIALSVTKAELVDQSFDQIRDAARSHVAVLSHILELICDLIKHNEDKELEFALLKQASLIERASQKNLPEEVDSEKITNKYQAILMLSSIRSRYSASLE